MRRWITSMLAAFLAATPLLALDKAADEKGNDRATQLKNLQADYRKAVPELQKAFQAAETAKEREAIIEKLNKQFTPRILKLVEANPKDNVSFQALSFAVQSLPNVDSKVFDLLAEHWAKDDSAANKRLCMILAFRPQDHAKKFLQNVLEQNKDKDLQGYACFALAKMATQKSDDGDAKATLEAEKYYDRAVKDFADVRLGQVVIGEQAKTALHQIRHFSIGKTAPNVESKNLDDKKVQLKDYRGKIVVLDIWATWCPPCRAMIPHEREMVKKFKGKPFALISISADTEKKTLTDFIEKEPMPWTHWWNGPSGGIVKDWNVEFFPTIYVLDGEGVIRHKNLRGKELEEAVEKLLDEKKDKKDK
jgi:thiol-disulfide isomerase/thioredoxin